MNSRQKLWVASNLLWLGIFGMYILLRFTTDIDFFIIALGLFVVVAMNNYWRYVSDVIWNKMFSKLDRKIGYLDCKVRTNKLLKHHITHYCKQMVIQKDVRLKAKAKIMREGLERFAEQYAGMEKAKVKGVLNDS